MGLLKQTNYFIATLLEILVMVETTQEATAEATEATKPRNDTPTFIRVYEQVAATENGSHAEVAEILDIEAGSVYQRQNKLRNEGVNLSKMPKQNQGLSTSGANDLIAQLAEAREIEAGKIETASVSSN